MTWETTASPIVLQVRTQLAGSATWQGVVGAANAANRVHFPSINLGGVRGSNDPIPAVLVQRPQNARRKWVEGASGLINGSIGLMFYFPAILSGAVPAAYAAGRVEDLVDTIVGDLIAQRSGIPFRDDATIGEASDPTDAEIAANSDQTPAAFRSCLATLPYGYSP